MKRLTLGDVAENSCPLHVHGMTVGWLYRPAVSRVRTILQLRNVIAPTGPSAVMLPNVHSIP